MMSIGEVSELANISTQTLRVWDNDGKIKADYRTTGGKRFYNRDTVDKIMETHIGIRNKMVIGYTRVPNNSSEYNSILEDQEDSINKIFDNSDYSNTHIISDVGSSVEELKGFNHMLKLICVNKVEKVYVSDKSTLGVLKIDMLKTVAECHNTELVIIRPFDNDYSDIENDLNSILKVVKYSDTSNSMSNRVLNKVNEIIDITE